MAHAPGARTKPTGRRVFALAVVLFVGVLGALWSSGRFDQVGRLGVPTMQPTFVDAYAISSASVSLAQGADPLVQKYNRIDTVYGLVNLMDDAQAAGPRFAATALILYGSNEQLIPKGPVDTFLKNLPPDAAPRQRLVVYPQGYHMLLRDLDAETVRKDVLAWVEDPKAPLPSGAEQALPRGRSAD